MYDRVLIPVDGSEAASRAAAAGISVADLFDAEVAVVTVVDTGLLDLRGDAEVERLRESERSVLEDVTAEADRRGITAASTVLEGNPAERIAGYADEWDADLVVTGRQGHTGLGKRILGGVTERVLHWSDVPVLVVPEAGTPVDAEFDRVLVPTDGSENAEAAVEDAGAVAGATGATVDAVYVLDLQAAGGPFSAGGLDRQFVERLESRGEAALDRVADRLAAVAPDVEVSTALVRKKDFSGVAPLIRDYATDQDVDLVVMGSHGRSNLARQVLGSVTSGVLRTVDVPVLVVKRGS